MDRSDVITLIGKVNEKDSAGIHHSSETEREVFCDVKSITRSEWFEAGRSGIAHPELVFVMNRHEYAGEQIVEYGGVRYGIYRTYAGKNENLELYAEPKGGLHHG